MARGAWALAWASLIGNMLILTLLMSYMALMSWYGKGWDAVFMTLISTLTGSSFGWTGMAFSAAFQANRGDGDRGGAPAPQAPVQAAPSEKPVV